MNKSTNHQITKSPNTPNQQINKSTNQQINRSTNQQINNSTDQQINKSTNRLLSQKKIATVKNYVKAFSRRCGWLTACPSKPTEQSFDNLIYFHRVNLKEFSKPTKS